METLGARTKMPAAASSRSSGGASDTAGNLDKGRSFVATLKADAAKRATSVSAEDRIAAIRAKREARLAATRAADYEEHHEANEDERANALAAVEGFIAYRVVWHGAVWKDVCFFILNEHPLLGTCFAHSLHPFARGLPRLLMLTCVLMFTFFTTAWLSVYHDVGQVATYDYVGWICVSSVAALVWGACVLGGGVGVSLWGGRRRRCRCRCACRCCRCRCRRRRRVPADADCRCRQHRL